MEATAPPQTVSYCHCVDCRRWTGAPVAAFAQFETDHLTLHPDPGPGFSAAEGVRRWSCPTCGSPPAATFDYLPGHAYVPIGILDTAAGHPPALHSHAASQLPWLHLSDDLPRSDASARDALNATGDEA